jgi:hypothetical protein
VHILFLCYQQLQTRFQQAANTADFRSHLSASTIHRLAMRLSNSSSVAVRSLAYIERISALTIGFDDGAVEFWALDRAQLMHRTVSETRAPVVHLVCQQLPDDRMLYLWACQATANE